MSLVHALHLSLMHVQLPEHHRAGTLSVLIYKMMLIEMDQIRENNCMCSSYNVKFLLVNTDIWLVCLNIWYAIRQELLGKGGLSLLVAHIFQ